MAVSTLYNIMVPCSHWRQPLVTLKQLPSLALGNDFWEMNAESFQRLQQLLEVAATVLSCGDCWKLRRVASEACNMMENTLSILIFIFSNKQRPQTESCLFSSTALKEPIEGIKCGYCFDTQVIYLDIQVNTVIALPRGN